MGEMFSKIGGQIAEFIKGMSPVKRIAMLVTGAGIAVVIGVLFFWAGDTTFSPLMTNLSNEDSANIMRFLRDKRIPFRVDQGGKSILVPPENMYELRLELATAGMPQSSVVGYELFDKQSLGTTSFVQKVNQKRALEGELMRTINSIRGVKRSRVHLAMPTKSTFVEDQKKSSASVVLDLDPGTVLNEKQVYGVGNLVARAIEGMEVTDVVIMDSNGKVLSKNPSDPIASATASQLDYQTRLESEYERRVSEILGHVVGEGKVVAKVTADLDFSQVSETSTSYDADGSAVRSTERKTDSMQGVRPGPYGLAGAASNQPGQPPAANGEVRNNTTKNNEVVNYAVPDTVRRVTKPVATLKRISVAVVIDGKMVKTADKDGVVQSKVEAWTPEKLKEFETLVASAVGIDRKRGDTLEIKSIEFTREDFDEAARVIAEKERKSYIQTVLVYTVIGISIVLFFLFVVRPFIKWVTENTIDSVDTFLPQTIEELERIQKNQALPGLEESMPTLPENLDPAKVEGEMMKEKIITLVDANPHKAALILREWLHTEKKKAAEKKEDGKSAG